MRKISKHVLFYLLLFLFACSEDEKTTNVDNQNPSTNTESFSYEESTVQIDYNAQAEGAIQIQIDTLPDLQKGLSQFSIGVVEKNSLAWTAATDHKTLSSIYNDSLLLVRDIWGTDTLSFWFLRSDDGNLYYLHPQSASAKLNGNLVLGKYSFLGETFLKEVVTTVSETIREDAALIGLSVAMIGTPLAPLGVVLAVKVVVDLAKNINKNILDKGLDNLLKDVNPDESIPVEEVPENITETPPVVPECHTNLYRPVYCGGDSVCGNEEIPCSE